MTIHISYVKDFNGRLAVKRSWPRCTIRVSQAAIVIEGAELRTEAEIEEFLAQFKVARQDHRMLRCGHDQVW